MAKTSTAKPKAKAVSLHIGLNAVDPVHYGGWSGELAACERDAIDMAALAKMQKMRPTVLLTRSATRAKTIAAINAAAKVLKKGDLFFLTYSGHGGQVRDVTGEEPDKRDETWCLFDSQLIDDELYFELAKFASGVRILVLSDSCHSGTVTRDVMAPGIGGQRSRMMPPDVAEVTYEKNKEFYDGLQKGIAKAAKKSQDPDSVLAALELDPRLSAVATKFKPAAILISGCQDNQTSLDGDPNGAFTGALLKVWNNGTFVGDYARFHKQIVKGLPASQTPNLFPLGAAGRFLKQQPFRV
jgi:hypothetical protein